MTYISITKKDLSEYFFKSAIINYYCLPSITTALACNLLEINPLLTTVSTLGSQGLYFLSKGYFSKNSDNKSIALGTMLFVLPVAALAGTSCTFKINPLIQLVATLTINALIGNTLMKK